MTRLSQVPSRDARRNREAILRAARGLLAESADVTMQRVARDAGVGQATLYRNFPDRSALVVEVLEAHLKRVARIALVHDGDPNALHDTLEALVEAMVSCQGFAAATAADAGADGGLGDLRRQLARLLDGPLRDAKAAGWVRGDLTVDDVLLILAMACGAMRGVKGHAARSEVGRRVLDLVLDGIDRGVAGEL